MSEPVCPAVEAAPEKPKKHVDQELTALKKIGAILHGLTDAAKRRVLSYYTDRTV